MKNILIIDDDVDFCNMLKLGFNREKDMSLLVSYDGEDGIEMAKRIGPDLVIIDIMFPKGRPNGQWVREKILNDPNLKDTPVIFLTALIRRSEEIDWLWRVGEDVISKDNFELNDFLNTVRRILKLL